MPTSCILSWCATSCCLWRKRPFTAPLWTADIQAEWTHHLIEKRPDRAEKIKAAVSLTNGAFPEAVVDNHRDLIPTVTLPDVDDRHVLAAAIRGSANVIVTENVADFPAEMLDKYDLETRTADGFVLNTIVLYFTDALAAPGRQQLLCWCR